MQQFLCQTAGWTKELPVILCLSPCALKIMHMYQGLYMRLLYNCGQKQCLTWMRQGTHLEVLSLD